jgi:hypothetical protein
MDSYTVITSGGHRTTATGYLAEIIEANRGRRVNLAIWVKGLMLCQILTSGEVVWTI